MSNECLEFVPSAFSFRVSVENFQGQEFIELLFRFFRTEQLKRLTGGKPRDTQTPHLFRFARVAQLRKMRSEIGHWVIRSGGKIRDESGQAPLPIGGTSEKLHERECIRAIKQTARSIEPRKFSRPQKLFEQR